MVEDEVLEVVEIFFCVCFKIKNVEFEVFIVKNLGP